MVSDSGASRISLVSIANQRNTKEERHMPHYDRYYPDYLRKHPEIEGRPDVLRELRKSDRKMKYIESDLKREEFIENQQKKLRSLFQAVRIPMNGLQKRNKGSLHRTRAVRRSRLSGIKSLLFCARRWSSWMIRRGNLSTPCISGVFRSGSLPRKSRNII